MSMSLNKVMIIGNVGRLPEMRYTPNGNPVTTFTVATNRRWLTPEGEPREETEWFNVVTWNKLAETCNQLITSKGIKVYVEGRLQTRSWEGQDGQKRTRTEVVAGSVILLDSRQKTPMPTEEGYSEDMEPEDIPF
ncbi:MAG: single-stranded DNA-binding protein [Chloroflexota bacterium]